MGYPLRQLAGFEDRNLCNLTMKGCCPPPIATHEYSKTPHKAQHLTILALAISSVLTAVLLFLTYYLLLLRLRSHFRRGGPSHTTTTTTAPLNPQEEEVEVGTHGPNHEGGSNNGSSFHHVWYIRTVGLDDVAISSIAVSAYKSDSGLVDGTGCSVCLSEFEEGELVKPLPMCRHAFHVSCIDTWLHGHVNCPLCRTPVVSLPTPPQHQVEEVEEAATGSFFVGGDNPLPSPVIASNRIGPFSNLAPPPPSSSSLSSSSPSSSGDGGGGSLESGTVVQADPVGSEENWVTIDLNEDDAGGQHQHMRRSVSMNALAMGELVSLDGEGTTVEKGAVASEKGGKDGGVDRCLSTNGRRFFFPRFSRSRKTSSILPL